MTVCYIFSCLVGNNAVTVGDPSCVQIGRKCSTQHTRLLYSMRQVSKYCCCCMCCCFPQLLLQSANDNCLPAASAKAKKKLEEVIDLLDDEPESESQDLRGSPQPVSAPRVMRSAVVAQCSSAAWQRRVLHRNCLSMFCSQKVCLLSIFCIEMGWSKMSLPALHVKSLPALHCMLVMPAGQPQYSC